MVVVMLGRCSMKTNKFLNHFGFVSYYSIFSILGTDKVGLHSGLTIYRQPFIVCAAKFQAVHRSWTMKVYICLNYSMLSTDSHTPNARGIV